MRKIYPAALNSIVSSSYFSITSLNSELTALPCYVNTCWCLHITAYNKNNMDYSVVSRATEFLLDDLPPES